MRQPGLDPFSNLLKPSRSAQGVVDPASVTMWALENSASISGSLLTTEALVTDAVRTIGWLAHLPNTAADPTFLIWQVREEDDGDYEPDVGTGIGAKAAEYAW